MVCGVDPSRNAVLHGAGDVRCRLIRLGNGWARGSRQWFGRRRGFPQRPACSGLPEGAVDEVGLRAHAELVGHQRNRDLESERIRAARAVWPGTHQRRDLPSASQNHLIGAALLERDRLDIDWERTGAVAARQTVRKRSVGDPGGVGCLDLIRESAKAYPVAGNPPHGAARVHQVELERGRQSEVAGRNVRAHRRLLDSG
jgi:hypothetical protein